MSTYMKKSKINNNKRKNKSKIKIVILMGGFLIAGTLVGLSNKANRQKEKNSNKDNLKVVNDIDEKESKQEKEFDTEKNLEVGEDLNTEKSLETEKDLGVDNDISANTKKPKETPNIKAKGYYKKLYKSKNAYTKINISNATNKQVKAMFYSTKVTKKIFKRIYGKSYKENCTVPKSDLRYVRVLHYGFDGNVHIGELITNKVIAKDVCSIFYKLFKKQYQIEKMILIDEYDADDNLSMADNNTSCFNFRFVSGTERLSNHSYGLAIDINPLYNPYIHTMNNMTVCEPENGKDYQNRSEDFEHKIGTDDLCYKIFKEYGFSWGGEWINSKDYQHFQYEV